MIGTYITPTGLTIPTVTEIQAEVSEALRANTGLPLLNTDPESPIGQIIGINADRERAGWEVLQIAYNGLDPNVAEGAQLEGDSALTGTQRAGATRSKFGGTHKLVYDLEAAKTVPVGARFTTESGSPVFEATEAVTSTTAGEYLGAAECTELGPIACNANTLTVAVSNVPGLNSVNNPFDAALGTNEDTDSELRIRREDELYAGGASTADAIRSDLLAFRDEAGGAPILECVVLQNETESWSQGLPPKSFEALVFDGIGADVENDDIASIIWQNKPAGMKAFGTETGQVVDGNSEIQTVPFSRPEMIDLEIEIDVLVNPVLYAGDEAVATAIAERIASRRSMGIEIRAEDARGAAQILVEGVIDVTRVQIGILGDTLLPDGENFPLTRRQIGLLQAASVTVTAEEE